jgi:cytochrome c oxidase subunit II
VRVIPDPVTDGAQRLHDLWWFSNWVGLAVALLVWGLTAYVVIRYRRRDDRIPGQHAENIPIEVLYTVGPLAILAVFFALSVSAETSVAEVGEEEPEVVVEVHGFQWQWEFRYRGEDVIVTGTTEERPLMVLPVGETVRFHLYAVDVIHSFWVPEFLEKRDLIPGVDNTIELEVVKEGEWRGICAEYCGLDHYKMLFDVRAVPPDEYRDWLEEERAAA